MNWKIGAVVKEAKFLLLEFKRELPQRIERLTNDIERWNEETDSTSLLFLFAGTVFLCLVMLVIGIVVGWLA